jgi:hypothetical protein
MAVDIQLDVCVVSAEVVMETPAFAKNVCLGIPRRIVITLFKLDMIAIATVTIVLLLQMNGLSAANLTVEHVIAVDMITYSTSKTY